MDVYDLFDILDFSRLFYLRPGIFKRDGAVENRLFGGGVRINAEIAGALELEFITGQCFGQGRLEETIGQYFKGVGVDDLVDILAFVRVFCSEQAVVKTDFGFPKRMVTGYDYNRAGMLIALMLNLTLLPALLVLFRAGGFKEAGGFVWAAPLDRFLARRRGWICAAAGVLKSMQTSTPCTALRESSLKSAAARFPLPEANYFEYNSTIICS